MLKQNADRISDEFWERADLVMEVVSPEKPERDYVTKRLDYAEAGIPEYWIVDPRTKTVEVLKLEESEYVTHTAATNQSPAAATSHGRTRSQSRWHSFKR